MSTPKNSSTKCPRCNVDMREGEAFIENNVYTRGPGFEMNPISGMRFPIVIRSMVRLHQ